MTHRYLRFPVSLFLLIACSLGTAQAKAPDDEGERLFYSLGVMFASSLNQFQLSSDELALVLRGVEDSVAGNAAPLDMQDLQPRLAALHAERSAVAAAEERKAAAEYLEEAAAKKGAVKLDSGLVMTVLTAGSGASPKATDTVQVHYTGMLRDGAVFDTSVNSEPAQFPLNGVIPCWTEGVQRMKVGGKSRIVCPAALAYGERGSPPRIPPEAALTFEIDLLSIVE